MLPDKNVKCPSTGFNKSCREIIAEWTCPKWVKISGMNPNTGEQLDDYGCVDSFLPMLLIENSKQQRSTAAAVESFRNEMVNGNQQSMMLLAQQFNTKLLEK
jgi:hypothetical protein